MSDQPAVELPENVDQLVDHYVRLRDKLKESDDAHKKKTAAAREHLMLLNNKLLAKLNEVGGDAVKTPHGTAYRTSRNTASIADGDAFREYVLSNEAFDLLDWKANSTAVADFIGENAVPPPGINFSVAYTVGVRRK